MSENRYDVLYYSDKIEIDFHFCREWDTEGGCYGTNSTHGFTWEEAKQQVIQYYEQQIEELKKKTEGAYFGIGC